jgi:DNA-binding XRE family transcriptional regulator
VISKHETHDPEIPAEIYRLDPLAQRIGLQKFKGDLHLASEFRKSFSKQGRRIREIRELARLGRVEFARRIGVSPPQITRYEKGWDRPGRATTLNICREFNVNEKWLTSGEAPIYRNTASTPGKFIITETI